MDSRVTRAGHPSPFAGPRVPQPTRAAALLPLASFSSEFFSRPGAVMVALVGLLAIAYAIVMLVRVRPFVGIAEVPDDQDAADDADEAGPDADDDGDDPETQRRLRAPAATPAAAAAAPPPPAAPSRRPRTNTERLRIRLPDIDPRHPDVWGTEDPFHVEVHATGLDGQPLDEAKVRLARSVRGKAVPVGEAVTDASGTARFTIRFDGAGEEDLVAVLMEQGRPAGQAVRALRVVVYRDEVVETFEDFRTWAIDHFPFLSRKHTAREFVDRFVDGRPGTPSEPLETVVAIYERANFSDHVIDRTVYVRMVDAFLELEGSGALDAQPQGVPA